MDEAEDEDDNCGGSNCSSSSSSISSQRTAINRSLSNISATTGKAALVDHASSFTADVSRQRKSGENKVTRGCSSVVDKIVGKFESLDINSNYINNNISYLSQQQQIYPQNQTPAPLTPTINNDPTQTNIATFTFTSTLSNNYSNSNTTNTKPTGNQIIKGLKGKNPESNQNSTNSDDNKSDSEDTPVFASGLFVEDTNELAGKRKTSISFDKIKQISLAHSLKSEEELHYQTSSSIDSKTSLNSARSFIRQDQRPQSQNQADSVKHALSKGQIRRASSCENEALAKNSNKTDQHDKIRVSQNKLYDPHLASYPKAISERGGTKDFDGSKNEDNSHTLSQILTLPTQIVICHQNQPNGASVYLPCDQQQINISVNTPKNRAARRLWSNKQTSRVQYTYRANYILSQKYTGKSQQEQPLQDKLVNLNDNNNKQQQACQTRTKNSEDKDINIAKQNLSKSPCISTSQKTSTTTNNLKTNRTQSRRMLLKNWATGEYLEDHLAASANKNCPCDKSACLGSLINPEDKSKSKTAPIIQSEAKNFIDQYFASIKRTNSDAHKARLVDIEQQINSTGTYYLKETELIYGAKLAWRNSSRCIGRIQWSKLHVYDARFVTSVDEMFEAICNHIKYATNKGQLRSAITIFPPRIKSQPSDWRIWNNQLIGYAGYQDKKTGQVIGDPINIGITEVCQKLGWKGEGSRFDVLPLVLSAAGGQPKLFVLPQDLVLRVKIKHPSYPWMESLGLEWYALPAVSNMMLDLGGIQFTAAPFNGWYMVTEIGTRDLGDVHRYNVLESVAIGLGINTKTNATLWKDMAIVILNQAILESFRACGVTIVDHHTAAESFMMHLSNETQVRGGCPADWVWLVPPTSGSATPIFHQELTNYNLLPNYEYMEPIWKNFDWSVWELRQQSKLLATNQSSPLALKNISDQNSSNVSPTSHGLLPQSPGKSPTTNELTPRKPRFKEVARIANFTAKLYGHALSRRIKATILYATETGKSERFAQKLAKLFSGAFNVHLTSMIDYDMTCLEHEALLLIVTSTFGNGDPPETGERFSKHLAAIKLTGDASPDIESINSVSSNPFFQMISVDENKKKIYDSETESSSSSSEDIFSNIKDNIIKLDKQTIPAEKRPLKLKTRISKEQKQEYQTIIKPLSNVRFGVFALGSTAYPHFCAFGRYVDQTLGELGAERILKCTCGDELCGQEKAFNEWSSLVYMKACETFCISESVVQMDARPEVKWTPRDVKFVPVELVDSRIIDGFTSEEDKKLIYELKVREALNKKQTIESNLVHLTSKKIIVFKVKSRTNLHAYIKEENLQTISLDLEPDRSISFEAGDHLAVYSTNKSDMVDKILARMQEASEWLLQNPTRDALKEIQVAENTKEPKQINFNQVFSILVKQENLDLTSGSGPMGVGKGAKENWVQHERIPVTSIREALTRYLDITSPPSQDFLSILARQCANFDEKNRLLQLSRNFTVYEDWKLKTIPNLLSVLDEFKSIQFEPAFITQLPMMMPRFYSISGINVSLTVGIVRYTTFQNAQREGLCSNYLLNIPIDSTNLFGYIRSAPSFHMPHDKRLPVILISAGTGIAPFRSFWQQRFIDMQRKRDPADFINSNIVEPRFGRLEMYFGCRNPSYIPHKSELDAMKECGVITGLYFAYSRPKGIYVQEKLLENKQDISRLILEEDAEVYVCGDVAMADGVYKNLVSIFSPSKLLELRSQNRYHEDIFGAKNT